MLDLAAARGKDSMIIPDLANDRRFGAHPVVAEGKDSLLVYPAVPLRVVKDDDGVVIGAWVLGSGR